MSTALGSSANVSPLSAWLLAIRPKTLPAAVAPVLVGCAVAWHEGGFGRRFPQLPRSPWPCCCRSGRIWPTTWPIFYCGADTAERLGPVRVTQTGLGSASARSWWGPHWCSPSAVVPGLYLVSRGGPVLAGIGLLAILAAVGAYTAGPSRSAISGWASSSSSSSSVRWPWRARHTCRPGTCVGRWRRSRRSQWVVSWPAILVVNNLRDIETDRAAGKRTLAVRIGMSATRWEYAGLLGRGVRDADPARALRLGGAVGCCWRGPRHRWRWRGAAPRADHLGPGAQPGSWRAQRGSASGSPLPLALASSCERIARHSPPGAIAPREGRGAGHVRAHRAPLRPAEPADDRRSRRRLATAGRAGGVARTGPDDGRSGARRRHRHRRSRAGAGRGRGWRRRHRRRFLAPRCSRRLRRKGGVGIGEERDDRGGSRPTPWPSPFPMAPSTS